MQLLKPQQNKDLKSEQDLRNIIRTQEILKAEQDARLKLANAEADFNNTLAKNREKWALEEEEHYKRAREMDTEIKNLELQKLNMLVPFDILKDGVYSDMKDAENFLISLRNREEYAEDLTEKLQDKLDDVGAREQDLKRKTFEIQIKEEGLKQQATNTIIGTERLNKELSDFAVYKRDTEDLLVQKLKAIDDREFSLAGRELDLEKREKDVNDRNIRLADERGVLDRAWRELDKRKA